MHKTIAMFTVCLLGASSTVSAAIIADYQFAGGSSAPTSSAANSDASDPFSLIVDFESGFSSSTFSAFQRTSITPNNEADALVNNRGLSFTVTADSGFVLNLTSVAFDLGGTTLAGISYTAQASLQSSVGGIGTGGTVLGTASQSVPSNTPAPTYVNTDVDLTGSEFQGLTSITFRLSIYDNESTSGAVNRIDNIVLNGTVDASVVPEPSTFLLLAFGAVGLVLHARRRRR